MKYKDVAEGQRGRLADQLQLASMLDELVAPDYINHPLQLRGLEATKQSLITHIKGSPDWHETTEDIVAEGDKVWLRLKPTGTHKGELRGVSAPSGVLPPTGKRIAITCVVIYQIVNAKIVERVSGICLSRFLRTARCYRSHRRSEETLSRGCFLTALGT